MNEVLAEFAVGLLTRLSAVIKGALAKNSNVVVGLKTYDFQHYFPQNIST